MFVVYLCVPVSMFEVYLCVPCLYLGCSCVCVYVCGVSVYVCVYVCGLSVYVCVYASCLPVSMFVVCVYLSMLCMYVCLGLFSVPTSGPQLVHQRLWFVLACLWESASKRSLDAYRKE